ncbi:MAG: sensor histidine kinase [Pseudolysinimonas sp.]
MTTLTPPRTLPLYWRLWAGLPKDLAYLLIAFPIACVTFGLSVGLVSAAAGTIATFFLGIVFLVGALYLARISGTLDLALLRWIGRPAIRLPDWHDRTAKTGFFAWLRALFANAHYWLYLVWTTIVNFIVATFSFSIAVTWFATALGGVTAWIWVPFIPDHDRNFYLTQWFVDVWLRNGTQVDGRSADILLYLVLGVVFIVTLPLVLRGLTWMHWGVANGMLGAFRTEALEREVADLSESRTAAVAAEGTALRRLERDIHDGPQQRLVRMQMDLAAAERQLDTDPDAARKLIAEATQQSRDALEELRALSRGFAPPILLDRGLVAALESLAVRSAVTVRVVSTLPQGTDLPIELERNAYFIAAEGLTNAVKHSGSTAIDLRLSLRQVAGAGSESDATWLDIEVTDDGKGGAKVKADHGIAGLKERVRGLGGTLNLLSPAGGPTVLTAHLPIPGVE